MAAVQEFLASDKHIHIMRDHPAHVAYMMGGTWGAKVDLERLNFFTSFKKLFQVGQNSVCHDSYRTLWTIVSNWFQVLINTAP